MKTKVISLKKKKIKVKTGERRRGRKAERGKRYANYQSQKQKQRHHFQTYRNVKDYKGTLWTAECQLNNSDEMLIPGKTQITKTN